MENDEEIADFEEIWKVYLENQEKKKEKEKAKIVLTEIINKENVSLMRSEKKIFVHGHDLTPSIANINEANFTKTIHDGLIKNGYRAIFPIQSHSWNEILKERSITIVSSRKSGKTMAFLPALLTLLSRNVDNVPDDDEGMKESGPVGIIIVQSSREVQNIHRICTQLVGSKDLRITSASGIWNFDEKCIDLLNGCDLLITTPPCFRRFSESETLKMFDKDRIKHLVLDNLDLMTEKFQDDINNILKSTLKSVQLPQNNPQIIITATCWQDYLHNLHKLSSNPVIVIDAYIEAALYAKTRFIVSRKPLDGKNETLMNYLRQFEWRTKKTAIIFNQLSELEQVRDLLKNQSLSYEILDSKTSENSLKNWTNEKKGCMTLLLIHDDILTTSCVGNVQILIIYSLPETWSRFSKRFVVCLNYYNYYDAMAVKSHDNEPRAIIMMDENNTLEVPRIINFLNDRRLVQQIPKKIQQEVQRITNEIEQAKTGGTNDFIVPLCSHIIKFASCSRFKCPNRHVFIPDDKPINVPRSGRIKFKIIGISSPLHYTAVITDYLPPNGHDWISYEEKLGTIYDKLKKLQEYMRIEMNQIVDVVKVGDLYALLDTKSHDWRRCKVLKVEESSENSKQINVDIELIDTGGRLKVRPTSLMQLPDEYKALQPLAVEIRIVNLIPCDFDELFDFETISDVENHMRKITSNQNIYLVCEIQMAVGSTIITTNVYAFERLAIVKTDIMKLSLRKYLLGKKFVVEQKDVLEKIYQIAKDSNFDVAEKIKAVVDIPKPLKETEFKIEKNQNERKLTIGKTYQAKLLHFENVETFYVQIVDKNFEDSVMKRLEKIKNYDCREPLQNVSKNEMCFFNSEQGELFRAVITEIEPIEVFLMDYGIKKTATPTDLFKIPSKIAQYLPFQAIECGIKGLKAKKMKTLLHSLGCKQMFSKLSKNEVFEMEVHEKVGGKYLVSIFDEENNVKELALQQSIAEMDEAEIRKREIQKAQEHLMKMLEDIDCVALDQQEVNQMLGLPSTARILPPAHLVPEENQEAIEDTPKRIEPSKSKVLKVFEKFTKNSQNCSEMKKSEPKADTYEENGHKQDELKIDFKQESKNPQKLNQVPILKNIYANMNIEWKQNAQIIMLKIESINSITYSLKVTATSCKICIKYPDKYALKYFEFYGRVFPQYVAHKTNTVDITILLIKQYANNLWPRLTFLNENDKSIKFMGNELKVSCEMELTMNEEKKTWPPGGFYTDNEDDDFGYYDDALDDENLVI